MPELLTSAEAATLLSVAPATVKRWADAGMLSCERTAGKHRRFRRDDVERFRARLGDGPAGWVEFLLAESDPHRIQARLLGERASRGSWHAVASVLAPVIDEIGRMWADKLILVVHEHLASERLSRGIARCAEALPSCAGGPTVLLATAEDEDHTLGLSLVELCVREAGGVTMWAGRRTPAADLAAAAGLHADVLAISASALRDAKDLKRQATAILRGAKRSGVAVLFGGGGPWPAVQAPGFVIRDFQLLNDWISGFEPGRREES